MTLTKHYSIPCEVCDGFHGDGWSAVMISAVLTKVYDLDRKGNMNFSYLFSFIVIKLELEFPCENFVLSMINNGPNSPP